MLGCINKRCHKVQWTVNPLNFDIFKHFTWTNHQISVITCKTCRLVILHFQAAHDTFLAYLYLYHIQHNSLSGLLLLSRDSRIFLLKLWWWSETGGENYTVYLSDSIQFHLISLQYLVLYNLAYFIGQTCLRKQEHDVWGNGKANVNVKAQNFVECLARPGKSGSELEVEVGALEAMREKIKYLQWKECKENYAHFRVLKSF